MFLTRQSGGMMNSNPIVKRIVQVEADLREVGRDEDRAKKIQYQPAQNKVLKRLKRKKDALNYELSDLKQRL